ncbi:MAG: carbohydrate binding domain-containing protein [Spirochaetes bacterium]|nr:carbohydrate binding domain-containing protein [Spirochaetota bacterium]
MAQQLSFEPELYTTPRDAWEKDKDSATKWNLWTTDKDAAKKWTGGTVFRSPSVSKDRTSNEEGAPMLHTVLTGIPDGSYTVTVKFGRGLGFSRDGGVTWTNLISSGGSVGNMTVSGGSLELWFDDRFADKKSPGNCYFDCIYLTPVKAAAPEVASAAVFTADFEGSIETSGFSWWSRDNKGSAAVCADAHKGSQAIKISSDGEKDWAFSSGTMIRVKPGTFYKVSAWVKTDNPKMLNVQISSRGQGKVLTWDIGTGKKFTSDGAWTLIESTAEIPQGCDEIYVRLTGNGKMDIVADDITLAPTAPPPPKVKKPLTRGFAEQRIVEKMSRSLIAIARNSDIYLNWRLLKDDPDSIAFNIYRIPNNSAPVLLTKTPLIETTDFIDREPVPEASYRVVAVIGGKETDSADTTGYIAKAGEPYLSIRTGTKFQKAGIADLNGDGVYDYVVKQPNVNYVDPCIACDYWKKSTNTYKIEAYLADGKQLWQYDLGWSIELGIWYSPYVVFDFDGDGKAEVAVKTGEGDPRDPDGAVRSGKEYISILDGMTGKEVTRADWPTRDELGDYNYFSRNQIGVAYLDGKTPCLIVARGTYTFMKVDAYQFHGGKLTKLWAWNTDDEGPQARLYRGQGQHNMHAADVDDDGRDEVILGSCVLDDNGEGLWSTGLGHCDHAYVGDIDPARPGLEIYYAIEPKKQSNGMCLADARTGKIIWGYDKPTTHIHSTGFVGDIDPKHPGMECYSGERDDPLRRLWSATGNVIADEKTFNKGLDLRAVYWDADPQREIFTGGALRKFDGSAVYEKIRGSQVAWADVVGDWREEMIVSDGEFLLIYATAIPASDRRVCLMQDPIYRIDVAHQAMGYPQVPTTSYCLSAVTTKSGKPVVSMRIDAINGTTETKGSLTIAKPAGSDGNAVTVMLTADNARVAPEKTTISIDPGKSVVMPFTLTLPRKPALFGQKNGILVTARITDGGREANASATAIIEDAPLAQAAMVNASAFVSETGASVKKRDDKIGSSGQSISHWDVQGHRISWELTVPSDGKYLVVVRYCTEQPALRKVSVDGAAPTMMTFQPTGGFSSEANNWKHAPFADERGRPTIFSLTAGKHTITMENESGSMNVNYIAVISEKDAGQ